MSLLLYLWLASTCTAQAASVELPNNKYEYHVCLFTTQKTNAKQKITLTGNFCEKKINAELSLLMNTTDHLHEKGLHSLRD